MEKKEQVLFRQAYNRIRTTILECMTIRSHPLRTKVYSPACQIAAPDPDYKISISRQMSCHIDHIDKLLKKKMEREFVLSSVQAMLQIYLNNYFM